MKSILLALALSYAHFPAFAAPLPPTTYELDMNLKLDGKLITSPRVVVLMKFALGTFDAEGKRVVYARPQVIAAENQAATITLKEAEGGAPADVTFTVTARRSEP